MRIHLLLLVLALPFAISAQDGVKREFYPSGQLQRVYWSAGDRTRFISYHENGKVNDKGSFKSELPDGRWTRYAEDGTRISRVKYDEGQRTGLWTIRTMDGLTHQLRYRGNSLVHGEQFDTNGTLVAEHDAR